MKSPESLKYTPGSAQSILAEHGINIVKVDGKRYLEKEGKLVLRPDKPKDCYQLLIDEFGVTEPRLINFR